MISQATVIDRIKEKYTITLEERYPTGQIFLAFTNDDQSMWNRESYCVTVGKRGKLTVVRADRVCADRKQQATLARLMAYEINIKPTVRLT